MSMSRPSWFFFNSKKMGITPGTYIPKYHTEYENDAMNSSWDTCTQRAYLRFHFIKKEGRIIRRIALLNVLTKKNVFSIMIKLKYAGMCGYEHLYKPCPLKTKLLLPLSQFMLSKPSKVVSIRTFAPEWKYNHFEMKINWTYSGSL